MSAPTPPDTSGAVAAVDAAAAQVGAANLDVSIRIASPGDNGAVTQSIDGQADAAQTAVQSDTTTQTAAAQAAATQVAPANVAVSVRIASPGNDGPVTQASTADTPAQIQYQPAAGQYQEPPSTQPAPQPTTETAPVPQSPAASTPDAPSLPSVWTWNWTWTCGDITEAGTTQTIDTGIQGWIWTWNLDPMCAAPSAPAPPIAPINPPQSSGVISPTLPLLVPPVPPALPQLPEPVPPQLPEPVTALPPAPAATVLLPATLLPATDAIAPVNVRPASMEIGPQSKRTAPLLSDGMQPPALPWAGTASLPDASPHSPPVRTHEQTASRPRAENTVRLAVLAFPPPPAGGSGGGGTGGGSGVVAALAIWMLLQLPGLAVLRLPPSRRGPRARSDDIPSRPG